MGCKLFKSFSMVLLMAMLIFVGNLGSVHSRHEPRDSVSKVSGSGQSVSGIDWSNEWLNISSGADGPESIAFDPNGNGPYTGVSDGRIIRWDQNQSRWIDFATTTPDRDGCEGPQDHVDTEARCGRPLGLSFDDSGNLYIADAYKGLLIVGPQGGLAKPMLTGVQGVPFKFLNDLVVDQISGVIYFTDTSTRYERSKFANAMFSGDNSGRLLMFDPETNKLTILLDNLMFPNGVALSKDVDFLLVAETTNSRILRYWLNPSNYGQVEIFANLPGRPDNIKSNENGEFWVPANSEKNSFFYWALSHPWLRKIITSLPIDLNKLVARFSKIDDAYAKVIKLNENGQVLETIESSEGQTLKFISDIGEKNGSLYLGSVVLPFVVKLYH